MSTILNRAARFGGNQKRSGNTGLSLAIECIDHFADEGDWRPLARLLKGLTYSKSDFALMRKIIGFGTSKSVKMKVDKNHPEMFVFTREKDRPVRSNVLGRLSGKAAEGHSFRSTEVKELVTPEKIEKAFDVDKYAHAIVLKMKKEGVNMGQLMLAVKADMQANS
jgi:hypothetical protein